MTKILLHRLKIHCSHKVATHFGLKIHFCIRCGCYGQPSGKSIGLAKHCGRAARPLETFFLGKWPVYIGKDVANRVPKLPKEVITRILNTKHPGRDAPSQP